MAKDKTPGRANDVTRPEFDLSQVLAHGPALSSAYGRGWGGFLMLAAICKASRRPLGIATILTLAGFILYKL